MQNSLVIGYSRLFFLRHVALICCVLHFVIIHFLRSLWCRSFCDNVVFFLTPANLPPLTNYVPGEAGGRYLLAFLPAELTSLFNPILSVLAKKPGAAEVTFKENVECHQTSTLLQPM